MGLVGKPRLCSVYARIQGYGRSHVWGCTILAGLTTYETRTGNNTGTVQLYSYEEQYMEGRLCMLDIRIFRATFNVCFITPAIYPISHEGRHLLHNV